MFLLRPKTVNRIILTCVSLGMTRSAIINSTTEEQQEGQES